jgi:hypothetical protein
MNMFYYIKYDCPQAYNGYSEWVFEAASEEEAKTILKDEMVDEDTWLEFREMSIEECIAHKEKEIHEAIKWEYIHRRYGNCTIKEISKIEKQLENDPETYYRALVDYDRAHSFSKRLLRQAPDTITMAEYNTILNKLVDAKTEEEFNTILRSVK